MHQLQPINEDNVMDFKKCLISLDTAATLRSIQDLGSKDELIKLDAYRLWGITLDNELVEDWTPPVCLTSEGRSQYVNYRLKIFDAIKNGKIQEVLMRYTYARNKGVESI